MHLSSDFEPERVGKLSFIMVVLRVRLALRDRFQSSFLSTNEQ
uniref:Uncharacterized protein n=1 Tax=Anguilla anguilla TaxID=7936 RepID=A0A0E9RUW3_ANGAN